MHKANLILGTLIWRLLQSSKYKKKQMYRFENLINIRQKTVCGTELQNAAELNAKQQTKFEEPVKERRVKRRHKEVPPSAEGYVIANPRLPWRIIKRTLFCVIFSLTDSKKMSLGVVRKIQETLKHVNRKFSHDLDS